MLKFIRDFKGLEFTLITTTYLVWWKGRGVFSGYNKIGLKLTDFIAIACLLILLSVFIYAIVKLWKSWKYILLAFFIPLFYLTLFGVFKSKAVLELSSCHESICLELTLRENGSFDFMTTTQLEGRSIHGYYELTEGEILLYIVAPQEEGIFDSSEIQDLKEKACVKFRAIDFKEVNGCLEVKK